MLTRPDSSEPARLTAAQLGPHWSTQNRGQSAQTSAAELDLLWVHLRQCTDARVRFFRLRCFFDAARVLCAGHIVLILVLLALVGGFLSAAL